MEPNFECAAQNGAEPLCRETAAVLCIMAKSDTAMTALGHLRPNWTVRATSAFLPLATELRTLLEVRFVPRTEVQKLIRSPRRRAAEMTLGSSARGLSLSAD